MLRWSLILGFLLLGSACGTDTHVIQPLDIYNDTTVVSDKYIQEVISFVNTITPNGETINLGDYWLGVWATKDTLVKNCADNSEAWGCISLENKTIDIVWISNDSAATDEEMNGASAGILAHELGHLYYWQTERDADPNHKHTEWFAQDGFDSVWLRTYQQFYRKYVR